MGCLHPRSSYGICYWWRLIFSHVRSPTAISALTLRSPVSKCHSFVKSPEILEIVDSGLYYSWTPYVPGLDVIERAWNSSDRAIRQTNVQSKDPGWNWWVLLRSEIGCPHSEEQWETSPSGLVLKSGHDGNMLLLWSAETHFRGTCTLSNTDFAICDLRESLLETRIFFFLLENVLFYKTLIAFTNSSHFSAYYDLHRKAIAPHALYLNTQCFISLNIHSLTF